MLPKNIYFTYELNPTFLLPTEFYIVLWKNIYFTLHFVPHNAIWPVWSNHHKFETIQLNTFSKFLNLVYMTLDMIKVLLFMLSISFRASLKAVSIGYKVDFFINKLGNKIFKYAIIIKIFYLFIRKYLLNKFL